MGSGIVAFEHDELGSACDELEALGFDFAELVLRYLQDVYCRKIDYRRFKLFAWYLGVEMFLASVGNRFIVFAVETDDMSDLKITIMFAGQHGGAVRIGALAWDGNDYAALEAGIIRARAEVWFD